MRSVLVIASTSGQPLPDDAVARLAAPPGDDGVHAVTAMTTWRSDDGHVAAVAWAAEPGGWHAGAHGLTLVTRDPWSLTGGLDAPGGVAFGLTARIDAGDDSDAAAGLHGASTLVRLRHDGTGVVAGSPTGGGAVYVAEGDGLVAIADRAATAARGVGGGMRRTRLPDLVTGTLVGDRTAIEGVEVLRHGGRILLRGRDGVKIVHGDPPEIPVGASADELLAAAVDEVQQLVALAASSPGERTVELGADPASAVVAAALAAAGLTGHVRLRPAGPGRHAAAAARLARALDAPLEPVTPLALDGEGVDARVRHAVGRVAGEVAPTALRHGPHASVRDDVGVLVLAHGPSVLGPAHPRSHRTLLSPTASEDVEARLRARRTSLVSEQEPAVEAVAAHVRVRADRLCRAAAELAAGATVLDPVAGPAVTMAALADPTGLAARLVRALHPPIADVAPADPEADDDTGGAWRSLAPVLESHVLGHARDELATTLDMEAVTGLLRSTSPPDRATRDALEGVLALSVWASENDLPTAAPAPRRERILHVDPPASAPVLVTGITSRSLLDLAGVGVPLDEVDDDALLGTRVDRATRDLVHRVLLAAGATPGHLPADLDDRLSGTATAHLADEARTLLARRGGTLVDPRIGLTLPFWRAHVGSPRVVLVAERPPDLAVRSASRLPRRELLGWWVDVVTVAADHSDVRVVDPGDLADLGDDEATSWDGLDVDGAGVDDPVRVARTVDSLVREVELDAVRPLLRTVRAARAAAVDIRPVRQTGAAAPLRVVDELWERAVAADAEVGSQRAAAAELRSQLDAAREEAERLRARRGIRGAWLTLIGRP